MIQYVTQETLPSLFSFCQGDPFGCKIASLARAYGLETTFAGFWLQKNISQTITAALVKLEHAAVLSVKEGADWEEIETFLPFTGVHIVLYSPEEIRFSSFSKSSSGMIMQWNGRKAIHRSSYPVYTQSFFTGGSCFIVYL